MNAIFEKSSIRWWVNQVVKEEGMLMKKLKLVRISEKRATLRLIRCPVVVITLASGEVLKRGCGRSGMSEFDACLRCLYCGNYLYKKSSSLESMWFHFRWAREFWRTHNTQGRDFVNGIPVTGKAETLPSSCLPDLAESRPPRWFPYFLKYSDREFREYMLNFKTG
jgi:hypothetical protein